MYLDHHVSGMRAARPSLREGTRSMMGNKRPFWTVSLATVGLDVSNCVNYLSITRVRNAGSSSEFAVPIQGRPQLSRKAR